MEESVYTRIVGHCGRLWWGTAVCRVLKVGGALLCRVSRVRGSGKQSRETVSGLPNKVIIGSNCKSIMAVITSQLWQ